MSVCVCFGGCGELGGGTGTAHSWIIASGAVTSQPR